MSSGLTVWERIAHLTNRFYLRMRAPQAWQAQSSSEHGFESLRGYKNALLYTFRRSGEAVPTPVWFGLADGKLYFRTYADTAKLKRIRRDSRVRVGPCDIRGRPSGPVVEGHARLLEADGEPGAEAAIRSNYGLFRRLYLAGFSGRVPDTYVEVTPG
jgi:PPOX class probable F420-dependent enzyme